MALLESRSVAVRGAVAMIDDQNFQSTSYERDWDIDARKEGKNFWVSRRAP
jgi:hypothetical protein